MVIQRPRRTCQQGLIRESISNVSLSSIVLKALIEAEVVHLINSNCIIQTYLNIENIYLVIAGWRRNTNTRDEPVILLLKLYFGRFI